MIEVQGLSITLGEFSLRDINIRVEEGEYFVVLGPTGAGKTVLVECIVGLHTPSSGRVLLDGNEVTQLRPEGRRVAYVPQDYCLFPHMTVRQNIAFGMTLRKRLPAEIDARVGTLAEMLHITGLLARHPLTLSGGEKQRVALARALAIKPRLLVLDEPLSAVDERTRERLCDELKSVQRELGTTTIHISHNFEETLAVADKIAIFENGVIMQTGTSHEVFYRPANEFVARFTGCENIVSGQVTHTSDGTLFEADGMRLRIIEKVQAGRAKLVVRPEEVRLRRETSSSAQNVLLGRVTRVIDKGPLVKALVQTGSLQWSALFSKQEARALNLKPDTQVIVQLPPSAIHILAG